MKNVELLRRVARDLDDLRVTCVFFGGTVVGVHLDRLPSDDEERPTTDVDCMPIGVDSLTDMRALERRMDAQGWQHDLTPGRANAYARIAPCGVPVDFVAVHTLRDNDPVRIGSRVGVSIGPATRVTVLDSAAMVAAKLAAFADRGAADPLMSHDLEDLAMLLSCCSTIEERLAQANPLLTRQVRAGLSAIIDDRYILEVFDGAIPRGVEAAMVLKRLRALAGLR